MIIGMTGTQGDLTEIQIDNLIEFLVDTEIEEAHHGDCQGGDKLFHEAVRQVKGSTARIIVHPPDIDLKRAFCSGDEIRNPLTYRQRNGMIVEECELLIVFPRTNQEEQRSGTWMTARMARKKNKPYLIFYPDGRKERIF